MDKTKFTDSTCHGNLGVNLKKVSNPSAYSWSWEDDSNSDNKGISDKTTFDITEIGKDGTYTVSVVVDGTDSGSNPV